MQKIITDPLPGAGAARTRYFEQRIERVFRSIEDDIRQVELELAMDPGEDGHVLVQLRVVATSKKRSFNIVSRRRRLPDALASVFDASEARVARQTRQSNPEVGRAAESESPTSEAPA